MIKTLQSVALVYFAFVGLNVVAIAPATAQAQPEVLNAQQLVEALQDGGLVMLIRHERTEVPSGQDDYSQPPTECRAQRNLSLAGVAGAYETGVNLRALGIEAERVISSPMCRASETARYMFGVEYEHDTRLMHHDPNGERNLDVAEAELRALLAELSLERPEANTVLISHGGNIFRATGLRLTEGEIGILRLEEGGEVIVLGQVTGSRLGFSARWALAPDG